MYFAQYNFIKKMSERSTDTQFELLSSKLGRKLKSIDKSNTMYIKMFSTALEDKDITYVQDEQLRYLRIYSTFLSTYKNMYSVYIGTGDDYFFEVINLGLNKKLLAQYNASPKDRWLIITMGKEKGYRTLMLFDKNLKLTQKTVVKTDYRPSQRPWYKLAISSNGNTVKSDPYMFGSVDTKGVTYTKKINDNMAICIDMLIKDIDKALVEKENMELISSYIINQSHDIVARSNDKSDSIMKEIIKDVDFQKRYLNKNIKTIKGKKYIYYIKKTSKDYLVSFANLDNISQTYRKELRKSTLLTFIISIILLPIVWYAASFVVKPILFLSKESEKIGKRDFDNIKKVDSKISEIHQLSSSIYVMAESIKNHQRDLEYRVQERTKELKKLSITDKLTGAYNRIKIDESLETEAIRQNRYERPFGIILIDIDFFKEVNDTYGHQAGDRVLTQFVEILRKNVRQSDIIGRWGGEEFIIICVEINLNNLVTLAQKLRREVEHFEFDHVKKKTASFGLTIYKKGEKVERFIARADAALYKAKENGRNRIEVG